MNAIYFSQNVMLVSSLNLKIIRHISNEPRGKNEDEVIIEKKKENSKIIVN